MILRIKLDGRKEEKRKKIIKRRLPCELAPCDVSDVNQAHSIQYQQKFAYYAF